jgi:hypothetical protein
MKGSYDRVEVAIIIEPRVQLGQTRAAVSSPLPRPDRPPDIRVRVALRYVGRSQWV